MQIRATLRGQPAEVDRIYQIQKAAYRVEAQLIEVLPEHFFPLKESLDELHSTKDEGYVCVSDGQILGAIFLEKHTSHILISKLIVDPPYFRKGIARSLLQFCLNLYPQIIFEVSTAEANFPAIRLYESLDFRVHNIVNTADQLSLVKMRLARTIL